MRTLIGFVVSVLLILLAAGCASSGSVVGDLPPLPHWQTAMGQDRYLIEYYAVAGMRQEMVNDFLLYHAAKLTLQQGFRYFCVDPRAERTFFSDCCYGYGPSSYIAAVPVIGGADPPGSVAMVEVRVGFGGGGGFRSGSRAAVVRFVQAPAPGVSKVFAAQKLVAELEAKYERPEYRAAVARLRLR